MDTPACPFSCQDRQWEDLSRRQNYGATKFPVKTCHRQACHLPAGELSLTDPELLWWLRRFPQKIPDLAKKLWAWHISGLQKILLEHRACSCGMAQGQDSEQPYPLAHFLGGVWRRTRLQKLSLCHRICHAGQTEGCLSAGKRSPRIWNKEIFDSRGVVGILKREGYSIQESILLPERSKAKKIISVTVFSNQITIPFLFSSS